MVCLGVNQDHPVITFNCTHYCISDFCPELLVVVQSLSCVRFFAVPRTAAHQASLSFTISHSLLKLMSIESMMPRSHPLLTPSPPAFSLPQNQGLFQGICSSNQVAKVLELQHQSFQSVFRASLVAQTTKNL